MSKFAQNCVFFRPWKVTQSMDSNEIWHVSDDRGSTVCCHIWPTLLVKGDGHKSPQIMKI